MDLEWDLQQKTLVEYHRVVVLYTYGTPMKVAAVVEQCWAAVHKALWPGSLVLAESGV
jgi:hypothetical protein